MSAINKVFKIKDTETGLYFSGRSCHHAVGTRFTRRESLIYQIKRVIEANAGIWPETWVVETVELSETVKESMDGLDVIIDLMLVEQGHLLLHERCESSSTIVGSFLELRRERRLDQFTHIGIRVGRMLSSWPKFIEMMGGLGLERSLFAAKPKGVVLFKSERAAVAARMADTLTCVFEMEELTRFFAERLNVPVEAM